MFVLFVCHQVVADPCVLADDGSMPQPKREEALQMIKGSGSVRVILISFKAGSTGSYRTIS